MKTLRTLFKQDKEKFIVSKSIQTVISIKNNLGGRYFSCTIHALLYAILTDHIPVSLAGVLAPPVTENGVSTFLCYIIMCNST